MGMSDKKILVANRGEIAIRVFRTAKRMGLKTVAIYSEPDAQSEHVFYADESVALGGITSKESYLQVDKVIAAALKTGAKYIHPGYGFLSERGYFVDACQKAGITFVGPSAESMNTMGDKIVARKTIDSIGVPRIPGSAGAVQDAKEAKTIADSIGYPVLLKAAAGGGGKGMRRVDSSEEIQSAFEGASREAQNAFNDGSMYVEKYILKPHHVEIQVFGDGKGGAVHLGERECSIQRRHQKVWEESPSPILNRHPETRKKMFEAGLKITSHIKYAGAGTLEFIVDEDGNFYFLEMNTRLQVEHSVTEWVTGVDLVQWQIQLAMGQFKLPAIPPHSGSSIEARVYAEDSHRFLPSPGPLGYIRLPSGPGVRSDSAFSGAGEISVHYDPMIAKISTWGPTREDAIQRMAVALDEMRIEPPKSATGKRQGSLTTNLLFLRRLAKHPAVLKGDTSTDLIPNYPELTREPDQNLSIEAAVALGIFCRVGQSRVSTNEGSWVQNAWGQRAIRDGIRGSRS